MTLKLIFTQVVKQPLRKVFAGLVTQQDFDIDRISDIHDINILELIERQKMYRLKTELNVVLYDPKLKISRKGHYS